MGVVYKAHHVKLDRMVALKALPHHVSATPEEQARFLQEARAAALLNHPHICTIHDILEESGEQFIVMEYVDGVTLRQRFPIKKSNEAIRYAIEIGEALLEAHGQGIVHRDVKPDNIMVSARNQIKIMDFGLAKLKGSLKLTKSSSTVGTLAYMAPEQIQGGTVDARSDIFSFGVVLYEMLAGHTPFRGDHEAAMMYSILNEEPESFHTLAPDASPELLHILNRALEKDPDERYQTVGEMVIDLRRLRKETSRVSRDALPTFPPTAKSPAKKLWHDKRMVLRGTVALLVAAVIVTAILVISPGSPSGRIPVAVISFENQTGEAQYDYLKAAIPNLLITSLEQSQYLQVMTWERMRDLLRQMGREKTSIIDTDLGIEICQRDSVRAIVIGSFVKAGDMFATDVKVIDVQTKELLRSAGSRGEGVASILKTQIDELSRQISEGIGLPEEIIQTEQRPVAEVTTSSMEAYKRYVRGREAFTNWDYEAAREHFEGAVAIDTTFAFAYRYLASSLGYLGFIEARNDAYRKAYQHAYKATELERLHIEARYAWSIERDRQKQIRIYQEIAKKYPNDKDIHMQLGIYYDSQGDHEAAIAALNKVLALDPKSAEACNQLGYTHAALGDYDKAVSYLERYQALLPESPNPHDSTGEIFLAMGWYDKAIGEFEQATAIMPTFFDSYYRAGYIFALKEEYQKALTYIDRALANNRPPGLRAECHEWRALYAFWAGRSKEALDHIVQAEPLAHEAGSTYDLALCDYLRAYIYRDLGQIELSREQYRQFSKSALALRPDLQEWHKVHTAYYNALIELDAGNVKDARAQLDTLTAYLPSVGVSRRAYAKDLHGLLSAEVLLAEGGYDQSLDIAKNRAGVPIIGTFYTFHRAFLNVSSLEDQAARAYARMGDRQGAIREYETIISRETQTTSRLLIHPLYHYRLGRLYEEEGMTKEAIAQYEKFLTLWSDADEHHPEPNDARARLERLQVQ
jgi:serine/threonine protein kinase/Tfp pilus assembly protein PilF